MSLKTWTVRSSYMSHGINHFLFKRAGIYVSVSGLPGGYRNISISHTFRINNLVEAGGLTIKLAFRDMRTEIANKAAGRYAEVDACQD